MTPLVETILWTAGGTLLGLVLTLCQNHPRRLLGIIPPAATGVFLFTILLAFWPVTLVYFAAGLLAGMLPLPLSCLILGGPAEGQRRVKNPWLGILLIMAIAAVLTLVLSATTVESNSSFAQPWIVVVLAAFGTASAWLFLYRPALEWIVEIMIWPMYRIRALGPGRETIPREGPLLIVANHSNWMDPIWLAKVLPRRIFPMMTSRFYDLPFLRWCMIHIVDAIRVQLSEYRREAPEIQKAVAYLDRGRCVVIFPEGRMRRSEDKPLHSFGQGVWQILKERPDTPVMVCWIEGGWGSFFSYDKGPPAKKKRFDLWWTVRVGISEPEKLDVDMLEDQRTTRRYLMQRCLEARKHVGLEPLVVPALAEV